MKFFHNFVFTLYKFWVDFAFLFNRVFKPCVIHGLGKNFSSFLLNLLKVAWVSNKLSVFDRYLLIEKLASFFSLHKICSQIIWLKWEIYLLLSIFLQSRLRILDLVTRIFEKQSCRKINCGGWSENVDLTLPDSISSKEV